MPNQQKHVGAAALGRPVERSSTMTACGLHEFVE